MSAEKDLAIRQLLARSSDCVWRNDADAYSLCWAIDGQWRLFGLVFDGRDAIKAGWSGFMAALSTAWQVSHNITLDIADDVAYGRIYLDETLLMPDGAVVLNRGIYHDTYKIEDGRWVFARRHIDFCYIGPPNMSGRFFAMPTYGPAPRDRTADRPATPRMQEVYG